MYEIPHFFLHLIDDKTGQQEELSLQIEARFLEVVLASMYADSAAHSRSEIDAFQKIAHQLRIRDFSHKTEFTHLRGIPHWKDWMIKTRHRFTGDGRMPYASTAIQMNSQKVHSMNVMVDGSLRSNATLKRLLLVTSEKPVSTPVRAKSIVYDSGLNIIEDATPTQVSINGQGFDLQGFQKNTGKFHLLGKNKIEAARTSDNSDLWIYVCEWLK
jgi:hypothetical protein